MKICVISDIHASDKWRHIVECEKCNVDRFVFLGDYFDAKGCSVDAERQFDNFVDILEFAKEAGNVDLLIGNHDLQYIGGSCTNSFDFDIDELAEDCLAEAVSEGKIRAVAVYDRYIFSHAGVSQVWMRMNGLEKLDEINHALLYTQKLFDFVRDFNADLSGDNVFQSPLWIRPKSLLLGAVDGYNQIVGHTRLKKIEKATEDDRTFYFTDTTMRNYIVVDTISDEVRIESL